MNITIAILGATGNLGGRIVKSDVENYVPTTGSAVSAPIVSGTESFEETPSAPPDLVGQLPPPQ